MSKIGILALQGNFHQHNYILESLGANTTYVRYPEELDKCNGLIIPGGESTAISIQINRNGLRDPLIDFSRNKAILGICAGMIMLASGNASNNVDPLGLMDFSIERNAWGRQINSFSDQLKLNFDKTNDFEGIFIRSPRISKIGKDISVLATYKDEPVMITDGRHCVCSFHPELGNDYRIHSYFLDQINV